MVKQTSPVSAGVKGVIDMTTLMFYSDLMAINKYVNKSTTRFYWRYVMNMDSFKCHYVYDLMGYSR